MTATTAIAMSILSGVEKLSSHFCPAFSMSRSKMYMHTAAMMMAMKL